MAIGRFLMRRFSVQAPRRQAAALVTRLLLALACAGSAQPLAAENPPGDRSTHDKLHERYALARLELAELDLEKASLLDKEGEGGLVSDHDLRRLRTRVAVLKELVAITREHPHGTGILGQRVRAKASLKLAEEDLSLARTLHERNPGEFSALTVRRSEAKAEIARLRLALWDDPANVPSVIDEIQMQIDQLTDHVVDLLDQADNDRINDALRQ